jgi:hypothetical protein
MAVNCGTPHLYLGLVDIEEFLPQGTWSIKLVSCDGWGWLLVGFELICVIQFRMGQSEMPQPFAAESSIEIS